MEIVNVRVDDRLIHGQVAAVWSKALSVTRMMVVDDGAVKDATLKSLLKMACPAECKLSILSVAAAAANLGSRKYEGDRIFLVVKTPSTVRALWEAGYGVDRVNLGNLAQKPGAQAVSRSVYLTAEERADIQLLAAQGVRFQIQRVPTEAPEEWEK